MLLRWEIIVGDLVVMMVVDGVVGRIRAEKRARSTVTSFQVVKRIQSGLEERIDVGEATAVAGPLLQMRRDPAPTSIVRRSGSYDAGRRMSGALRIQGILVLVRKDDGTAPVSHIGSLSADKDAAEDGRRYDQRADPREVHFTAMVVVTKPSGRIKMSTLDGAR